MDALKKLAELQHAYAYPIVAVIIVLTIIIGLGIQNTRLQTNMNKEMPQSLESIVTGNMISDTYGGADTFMILIQLDRNCEIPDSPKDIRDPSVIRTLVSLEEKIEVQEGINSIQSAGTAFRFIGSVPGNLASVVKVLKDLGMGNALFNSDYSATMMVVSADIGKSEELIKKFTARIQQEVDGVEKPACTKITITGSPQMQAVMMDMLKSDLVFTIGLAALVIFFLIVLLKRSIAKALIAFTPMIIGLIWTLGLMGWFDIPLSIATVGVGAMILGLGTEYGIFMPITSLTSSISLLPITIHSLFLRLTIRGSSLSVSSRISPTNSSNASSRVINPETPPCSSTTMAM